MDDSWVPKHTILKMMKADDLGRKQMFLGSMQTIQTKVDDLKGQKHMIPWDKADDPFGNFTTRKQMIFLVKVDAPLGNLKCW